MYPLDFDLAQEWRKPEEYPNQFHEVIRPIAVALVRNIDRLASLAEVLPATAEGANILQTKRDQACFNVLGRLERVRQNHPEFPRIVAEFNRLADIPTDNELEFPRFQAEQFTIEELMEKDEKVHRGVEAVLWALILSAWTTYETLATDLWVACFDTLPVTLGSRVMVARPKSGDFGGDVEEKAAELSKLKKSDDKAWIDMIGKLRKRFDVRKWKEIEAAHKAAFKTFRCEYLEERVAEWGADRVKSYDDAVLRDIPVVYALRNLIVHRGGVADVKFLDSVKDSRQFGSMNPGETVQLYALDVMEFCETLVVEAQVLLEVAQRALAKHAE